LIGDTPDMRELTVTEQRYQAVLTVIQDGETVKDAAARFGVSRKTVHGWLAWYEAGGSVASAGPRSSPSKPRRRSQGSTKPVRMA
jgi:transposase